jgi:aminobenzoyl-glutamate utilization protein B
VTRRTACTHGATAALIGLIGLITSLALTPFAAAAQEDLGSLSPAKRAALNAVEELGEDIHTMAMTLWDRSELALLEEQSAEFLAGVLEQEGFTVERGVAGMPTAFTATFSHGEGSPVLGVLAEYDALPGVGNAPVPHKAPREDGVTSGQGCGHNLFGAGSVGAAIALKRAMEREGLSGTVRLYGTPAEETVVGKVYMAKAGVFDDLDATLVWHPALETGVSNQPGRALNNFTVEFRGQAAHASADPWNGRSALDAVELMNHGVNMMREHIQPTARIHYVIPSAGEAPNVVPEYAKVWYYVRDTSRASVTEYYEWILDIAKAAAIATRTEHEVFLVTGVHEHKLNRPLQVAMQKNLELVGPPRFEEPFQAFAVAMQEGLGLERKGLDTEIKSLADGPEPLRGGSSDVAEVSYINPTVELRVTSAPAGVPWHSWATSASHGREEAVEAANVAAKVLALTGIDILTDADLLEQARAYFLEQTGGAAYQSPIPLDQKPPLP